MHFHVFSLNGMQSGVGAVIMEVSFSMASGIVKEKQYLSIFIMIVAFIANYFYKVSAIVLILICIALGVVLTLYREKMAELHPEVHFYKVDIDEDMDLATRFKVMSVPTLLYFRRGVVANKTIGVISASEMEQAIAEAK